MIAKDQERGITTAETVGVVIETVGVVIETFGVEVETTIGSGITIATATGLVTEMSTATIVLDLRLKSARSRHCLRSTSSTGTYFASRCGTIDEEHDGGRANRVHP